MIIATLTKVEGNVFVKKIDGSIIKLSVGDTLQTGDIVFGADDKSSYTVEYAGNSGTMSYAGTAPQMFDPTMIPIGADGAEGAVEVASANPFAQSILTPEELAALINEEDKENEGKKETTAGQEEVKEGEAQGDDFADRTGAITDVNSGLRNAKFVSSIAREEEQELFKREDSGKLDPIDPLQPTLPPDPILPPIITPPPVIDPPVITPPPLRATLDLSGDTTVAESGVATYTLRVSDAPKTPLVVTIQIGHITTEDGDLIPRTMTVTIPAGATSVTFPISNNTDTVYEGPEDYRVHIVSTSGGDYNQLTIGNDTVITTINDAQAKPTLTIDDQIINEQEGTMTFTVTLSGVTEADVTFNYTSSNNSATAGTDYSAVSGVKTIPAGSTSITITVPIHDDYLSDNNETFNITLSNPSSNATIADGVGIGTILDDSGNPNTIDGTDIEANHEIVQIKLVALNQDGTPVLIGGHYTFANSVNEGSSAKYMALAFAPGESVFSPATKLSVQNGTVNITLHNGTASGAGSQSATDGSQDFNNTPQTVTLGVPFDVATFDENTPDNNETFTVTMVSGTYTSASGGYENVTIDTAAVTTTIGDSLNLAPDTATVVEGGNIISSPGLANLLANDTKGPGSVITSFSYHDESGTLQTAVAGTSVNTQYGQLQINSDGTWSYTSDGDEVHPVGDILSDLATYTVSDGTNTQTESFTISVTDTIASLSPSPAVLDEDDLSGIGSDTTPEPSFVTQSLGITKGSDMISSIVFDTAGVMPTLTSGGNTVIYSYSNGDSLITATANGITVFTVQLTLDGTDANNSNYTFTLLKPIDHISADGENSINFTLPIKVNETDDVISSLLSLSVVDDIPTAVNDADASLAEGGGVLNTITSTGADAAHANLLTNDTLGADGASVTSITYRNEANTSDVTVAVPAGAAGVTVDTINGSLTVKADGTWSFTSDSSVSNPAGADASDTFTYIITDRDGDTSSATKTFNISDGADPTIAPSSLVVSEATLGTGSSLVSFTTAGDLNVVKGSDNIADTKFTDATKTALEAMGIKSGGADLFYTLSADKHVITATKTDGSGPEVFKVTITDPASVNAKYDFKLSLPLDHTKPTNDTEWILPFNVYTVDTDDNGIVDNDDDASGSFTVTVQDSTPTNTNQDVSLTEDITGGKIIRLSQDTFDGPITLNNGTGDQSVATNGSIDIYDGATVIGTLTNLGDGTVKFVPYPDYSNYNLLSSSFTYTVTDNDGDQASATIRLSVTPVADVPTMQADRTISTYEDNSWSGIAHDGDKSNSVALGLTIPTRADQVDQNNATGGDAPERLGLLTFQFNNNVNFGTATIVYDTDGNGSLDGTLQTITQNQSFTVDITNVVNYHPTGTSGTYHLTKEQYESLAIIPAEDNAGNIVFTIKTESHEVQDSGALLSSDVKSSVQTQTVTVDVKAVTDPVTLTFDSDGTELDSNNKTYTFTSISEGVNIIDMDAILTATSGDIDGSENRWYKVDGVPAGTVVTVGSVSGIADSTGSVTIKFPSNTDIDPQFTLKFPEQYSGTVNGTITLKATDTAQGSATTGIIDETDSVAFSITVTPVADNITFNIAQSSGLEDAGRSLANTTETGTIDHPENGIALHLGVISDDTDGSETFTIRFQEIPDGGAMYYVVGGHTYLADGVNIYKDGVLDVSGTTPFVITDTLGAGWQLEIKEFVNTTSNTNLTFIPPLNSNGIFDLKVSGKSVDGVSVSSYMPSTPLSLKVDVKGVADIPMNDDLKELDSTGASVGGGAYAVVANEDDDSSDHIGNSISLSTIYASGTPDSFDNSGATYDSEKLTIVISGLDASFDVVGATSMGGSGTSRQWIFDAVDIANVKITTGVNYSGEIPFTLKYITTENDGNSKTHPIQNVTLLVTPDAEATISLSTTVNEDTLTKVNLEVVQQNGETGETLGHVWIKASDVTGKAFTLYTDSTGTTLLTSQATQNISGTNYYVLDSAGANNLYIKYNTDIGSADTTDKSFAIKYTTIDSVTTVHSGTLSDTSTVSDATYSIDLRSVTDQIDATLGTISATVPADISVTGSTITVNTNTTITVPIVVTAQTNDNSDQDKDGSEKITRLMIEGVPHGVTVEDGYYAGSVHVTGDVYTEIWYVDIPDQAFTAGNSGVITYNLVLHVGGDNATYVDNSTVTVTAYNQDVGASEVSDTVQFNLNKSGSFTENSPTTDVPMNIDDTNGFVVDTTFAPHEDGAFSLADATNINVSNAGATSNTFSITIYGIENATLSGAGLTSITQGGQTVYSFQGSGTPADIQTAMQNLIFTPTANINANDGAPYDVKFTATLTTYADGGALDVMTVNYDKSLTPVTDVMSVIATETDGSSLTHMNEDTSHAFKINLSSVDDSANDTGVDYTISGNALSITHSGTTYGTLSWDGGSAVFDASNHTASIPVDKLGALTFTPAHDLAGTATFNYTITHTETNAPSSVTTTGSFDIVVDPVADGMNIPASASGDEDTYITLIPAGLTSTDSSEVIQSITLEDVPNGFLVFYGDSNIAANNAGGDPTTWVIPVSGANPKVSIKAPEHWSGTQNITVKTDVQDGAVRQVASTSVALTVIAVADTLTMLPTQAIGSEGQDISINLNAMAQDLDGSETMTLVLTGMGVGAIFKEDGILHSASYSAVNGGTYTLSGINVANINKMTFNQITAELAGPIGVTAYMVETSTALGGTSANGTFNVALTEATATSGDDTLRFSSAGIDGLAGTDTMIFAQNESVDFTALGDLFHNIEKLDLTRSGNHTVTMNSADVSAMNSTHAIEVAGDASDTLSLKDSGDHIWIQNGHTYTDINDNTQVTTSGFDASIVRSSATAGADIIGYTGGAQIVDGLAGNDRVVVLDGATVDYTKLSHIETIDLSKSGNHTLNGLSLDTIFTMTDNGESSRTLTIDGDAGDAVSAVDKTGWTKNSETSDATYKSYEYHKGSDVVTLKVDLDMTNNTGLA